MPTNKSHASEDTLSCRVVLPAGRSNFVYGPEGRFTIIAAGDFEIDEIMRMDAYSAAKAFVAGSVAVRGDLFEAIRFFSRRRHSSIRDRWFSTRAHLARLGLHSRLRTRNDSARNIRFHYDRSTAFYRQFLDERMLYSAGYFSLPNQTLEDAQAEKLERICDVLKLNDGDRVLDVGCGWGGLLVYAAEHFRIVATGCTISHEQYTFANSIVHSQALDERVTVKESDYRDLDGRFDKVVSVGMFEHVGHNQLALYFRKMNLLLEDGGLFLNRGIVRPEGVSDGPDTLFLQEAVFPGGELMHLSDVIAVAEREGFEVLAMEEFSPHYAMTCRRWVERLQDRSDACRRLVGGEIYRTWLLYLAASAVSFEEGRSGAVQVLMTKRPAPYRKGLRFPT